MFSSLYSFDIRCIDSLLYFLLSDFASALLQLYESLADQLTDIIVNAVSINVYILLSFHDTNISPNAKVLLNSCLNLSGHLHPQA